MKVIESNCQTGEVTERDMKPEEIAAAQAAHDAWLQAETAKEAAQVEALEGTQP
jgi:hypothetical protein